ncbi:MAG: sugar ABC transporter permease [Spirochaetales bacterium]|nr:sugar ABC transporter permease [Spirochaetales bacterium]
MANVEASKVDLFVKKMYQQRYLYLMSVPFIILVLIFNYIPIWGWIMSFQNFKLGRTFFEQEWVGLANFIQILSDKQFYLVLRNTLAMSVMGLIAGFTIPIIFAVSLNEVSHTGYKKIVQTISYLPHFVSWVVVAGIFYKLLSTDGGVVNDILMKLGFIGEPIQFMAKGKLFWWIVTLADIWKEMGWNSIIFISAITAIDPQLYDAAKVDGCGRFRQIWHITLPGIRSVVIVLLILSIGNLVRIGFEKQMLLSNPLVFDYSEVLDLYALKYGLGLNRFSFGTAIGMFSSLVSVCLLFTANGLFKHYSKESVM